MPVHAPPTSGDVPAAKRMRKSTPERCSPANRSAAANAAKKTDTTTTRSPADDLFIGGGVNASEGANGGSSGAGVGVGCDSGSVSNSKPNQSSSFRNVSACNRCRLRKNRCDQRLPSCVSCEKAGVACVGYDPITKKEIPRRYTECRYLSSKRRFEWNKG